MDTNQPKLETRDDTRAERDRARRPFVKPRLERRSKLPNVTNGTAGTFEPWRS